MKYRHHFHLLIDGRFIWLIAFVVPFIASTIAWDLDTISIQHPEEQEGYVHENPGEQQGYVLTTSSALLLKDSPISLSPFVLSMLDPALITPWFSLSEWFQGNELTAFETYHGTNFWQYGNENQEFINF